jgi:hypothetical protein
MEIMGHFNHTVDHMPNRVNLRTEGDEYDGQLHDENDYLQEVDEDGHNIAPRPQ